MPSYKSVAVRITTFINPHLFWIFETENAGKREALQEELKSVTTEINYDATVGEIVLVKDGKLKRAVIKSVEAKLKYNCWLIDYGISFQTNEVYKLPIKYVTQKPLVKQAALNNVVCAKEVFSGIGINKVHSIEFTPGVIKRMKEHISKATNIFFYCIREVNGIYVGEITVVGRDGLYELARVMIEDGILAENEDLFKKALEENTKVDDTNFLTVMQAAVSCTTPVPCSTTVLCTTTVVKNKLEPFQDVVMSKGVGRGSRIPKEDIMSRRPDNPKTNKAFLEKWVQESKSSAMEDNLSYDSDDDSKKDLELSRKAMRYLTKKNISPPSHESNDTSDSISDSASQKDRSPSNAFQKARQALKELAEKNKSNSLKSYEDKSNSLDVSDPAKASCSTLQINSTASNDSSSNVSVEVSVFAGSDDSYGEINRNNNQKKVISEHTVDNDSAFSPKFKSSPLVNASVYQSDVIKNILKGRGRGINKQSVPVVGKPRPEDETSSSGYNKTSVKSMSKLISDLQQKSNKGSVKEELSPSVSERPVKSDANSKTPETPETVNWDNTKGEKSKPKRKQLNILPAGISFNSSSYKGNCSIKNATKSVSEKSLSVSPNADKKSDDGRSTTSTKSKNISNKIAMNKESNIEGPKRTCPGGCSCNRCREWNSDVLFETKTEFINTTEPKKRKECIRPPLLFKTEADKNDVIEMKGYNYLKPNVTKTERATAPKVLIHGTSIPSPVQSLSSVPFNSDIHRVLRRYEQAYSIQSFAWPVLMRRMNLCMVGAPKSGKTMSYLPPVCSYLLEKNERYKELPHNTLSPIAVILCPETETAEEVYDIVLKLLDCNTKKVVPGLAVPPLDKKCLNQFQKQCDVLVATPVALVTLLRSRIITMKRLCHFVIEDVDKALQKFPKEIDNLSKLIQSMLSHRSCNYSVQMVVTAEQWTVQLENLMKCLNLPPVICIGSYLEAALYGRVDLQIQFLESLAKMPALANLLKDRTNVCKTVVLFNTDEEISVVKEYLHMAGVSTIIIYDTTERDEIYDLELQWLNSKGGKHSALLCTDKIYNHSVNINNAVLLVHYSLPNTWSEFSGRFSCLVGNYVSPLATKYPDNWTRCTVHTFIDEKCSTQFPKLVELLQRMRVKLSTKFQECYMNTIKQKETQNITAKIKLCPNLRLFGKCSLSKCKRRHMLSSELDYSCDLPKSGLVKFKIMHVQDVTSITVKLLQHTDSEGKTHKCETYDSLQEDLQNALAEQRICVFEAKPGGWYVVHSLENRSYYRCAVQKILKHEKITKKATCVTVRLLDTGVQMDVTTQFLYELPKKFRNIPPIGVDMYLANMVPPDLDTTWSSGSKAKVNNILKEADCFGENTYGISQILLQLGNTIWVKNVLFREDLSATNVTVTKLNLNKTLQDQNLIGTCENQLEGLYKLCKNANIELPDYNLPAKDDKLSNKTEEQVQAQWAYFENTACNEVYISSVISPSLFYVRLKKFYDLFENLQKDIQKAIAKPFYPTKFEVQMGKCYLAKDPESEDFCRVKIIEINNDMVEVFYVDFGDTATVNKSELKYISDELIVKLPFQVIECRLYGVESVWDDWEPAATDIVCEYIFEPNTDYFRTLYTTSCKEESASMTDGQKCAILLVDNFKEKVILINQLLIDCGEAVAVKNEDLDVQFNIPEKYVEEDEPDSDIDCDKDFTLDDVKMLREKHGKNEGNEEIITSPSVDNPNTDLNRCESRQSDESHHSWDIQINDAEIFLKQLIGVQVEESNTAISQGQELPPMRALPPAKHCTPSVVWYQTETLIKLNIVLPNLNNYEVQVLRGRLFIFKAIYDDKQYRLDLQLYDKVERTFQDSPSGPHVKVTLTKSKPGEWHRLIVSTQRMRHIKYDISQCVLTEEKEKPFLNLGKEIDGDQPFGDDEHEFVFGSEEDYSESDAESVHSSD